MVGKTAIIVQARVGSNRLPAKVLCDLHGKTVLHRVLERCARVPGADLVVCAVPDEPASADLELVARESGAEVFRGSETDVLARYLGAAQKFGADLVMRVTSDCPLIDPDICQKVIALREKTASDYAANNMPRTFPHGLDCEIFARAALETASVEATELFDHEHVSPWLRRSKQLRKANLACDDPSLASYRWTLDFPEDLDFFQALFAAFPRAGEAGMTEIVAFLRNRPDISTINAHRYQSAGDPRLGGPG